MFHRRRIFSLDFKENFISMSENGSFVFLCSTEGKFFLLILRSILFPRQRMVVCISVFCGGRNFSLDFKENIISTWENRSFVFLCSAKGDFFLFNLGRILFLCRKMEVSYFFVPGKEIILLDIKDNFNSTPEKVSLIFLCSAEGEIF